MIKPGFTISRWGHGQFAEESARVWYEGGSYFDWADIAEQALEVESA